MNSQLEKIVVGSPLEHADIVWGSADTAATCAWSADHVTAPRIDQRRYLVASITKPVVAVSLLKLVAEGETTLAERLRDLLPEFRAAAYRRITVRHLLTHTSGFADMLPDNAELRAANAGLPEFLKHAASSDLNFVPATNCQYSSIGFLLIGAIVEKLSGLSLSHFVQTEVFQPLGMNESWLGLSESVADQILPTVLPNKLPDWQPNAENWGWNSRYWRCLGAPWGGLISTARDLSLFAQMILNEGAAANGTQFLPDVVVREAIRDQTAEMASQSDYTGSHRSWGFGWRGQWALHSASFGDFVSPQTIGHWGATGTLLWIDPSRDRFGIILTTTPYEASRSVIQQISNVLSVADRP